MFDENIACKYASEKKSKAGLVKVDNPKQKSHLHIFHEKIGRQKCTNRPLLLGIFQTKTTKWKYNQSGWYHGQ